MAVYAVGDLQGCLEPLQRLLDKLHFDTVHDRLWLVGDLVNRGPQSLETLRFVRQLGDSAISVLGNHDLHLLATAYGIQKLKRKDTLEPILRAKDSQELIEWLRYRPLLHHDATLNWTMVHAGLPPAWDLNLAKRCAKEVENQLQSAHPEQLLNKMYGDEPRQWSKALSGMNRLRYTLNALVRMRYLYPDGRLNFSCKRSPDKAPANLLPWFRFPGRCNASLRIIFGHWSTLGLLSEPNLLALDTGCLWGERLSGARLDSSPLPPIISVNCQTIYNPPLGE